MKTILFAISMIASLGLYSQELLMKITNPQVNGNQVVYEVSAENFADMIAMQYSIHYDPAILSFVAIDSITLPGMVASDIYAGLPEVINTVWLDRSLQSVTIGDSAVMYRIVFEMLTGTYGSVCFAQNPLQSEFVKTGEVLSSFKVVDDCHAEPFQIFLNTTGTLEFSNHFGINVNPVAFSQKITFSLENQETLRFRIFDLNGRIITKYPEEEYGAGEHVLEVTSPVIPGIYMLTTEIQHKPVSFKVIFN